MQSIQLATDSILILTTWDVGMHRTVFFSISNLAEGNSITFIKYFYDFQDTYNKYFGTIACWKKGVESFYYVIPFDYNCLHWSALQASACDTLRLHLRYIENKCTRHHFNVNKHCSQQHLGGAHVMIAYRPSTIINNVPLFSWILFCTYDTWSSNAVRIIYDGKTSEHNINLC